MTAKPRKRQNGNKKTISQISPFTNQPKLNFDKPENADMKEFYNLKTTQTNLYASQFREKHTILPRHSRARNWKEVTNDEMRQIIAFQVLTGIVKKPEISIGVLIPF